jgi:formate/nitrite transporter
MGAAVLDALLPAEMAEKAEHIGVEKTRLDTPRLLVLAILAGAFIAFGAMFSTIVVAGADGFLPFGVTQLLAGLVFSVGLILVIVGGAELFTGNNLMVMAWAGGRVGFVEVLRAWALVYIGNFIGAAATAALVFATVNYGQGGGAVGAAALAIAESKASLPFLAALVRGVLGNVLVCLAVWLCYSARSTTDRILAIVPPVSVFVAAGFEHSVANMYLIPYGLMVKNLASEAFWTDIGTTADKFPALTMTGMLTNLVPVTIGNLIGGGVLVGAVYWFAYLRNRLASLDKS